MPETQARFVQFLFLLMSLLLSVQAIHPSPIASVDLICHTNHASECYPTIFQPTTNFQTVHDDQTLPLGLHIRMNLATGLKEAKLDELDLDDAKSASDLIVIDDSGPEFLDQSNLWHEIPIRPSSFDLSEGSAFEHNTNVLKTSSWSDFDTVLSALSNLQDLAHSSYWGQVLVRDPLISRLLFQLLSPSRLSPIASPEIRSAAASLLGTAIHNNRPALSVLLSHFYNSEWPNGPLEAALKALALEQLPSLLTRMVFLISGLSQEENQLKKFVEGKGLELLVRLYDAENIEADKRDKLRRKIANFVFDYSLQSHETVRKAVLWGKENEL